jgi:uncharacterized protein (DUF58 family)
MASPGDVGAVVDPEALLRLRFVAAEARQRRLQRTSARPGPFVTRRRGRGSETDDVRPWAHGDDVRHVDRNVTARTGQPHVRTFRDERERTTLLLADFRPPMLFGTRRAFLSVAAAELLALVGWTVAGDGGRVALLALGGAEPVFVKPTVGERAMIAVVGGLTQAHRAALVARGAEAGPLAPQLEAAARLIPAGGTVAIASGFDDADDAFAAAARQAAVRVDLAAGVVSDAFERAPPRGVYPFLDPAGRRGIGAATGAPVDDYPSRRRTDALLALGMRAVLVRAEEPPAAQIPAVEAIHGGR